LTNDIMTNKEIIEESFPDLKNMDEIMFLKIEIMLEAARMDQIKRDHKGYTEMVEKVFTT